MAMERTPERRWAGTVFQALLIALLAAAPALAQDDGEKFLEGRVDLLYRSVTFDGSENKFDEDFDGLESGLRLGELSLDWGQSTSGFADFARLHLSGLGGEPYESSSFDLGRKDVYDLKLRHRRVSYVYDLYTVTDDEDGHAWNTDNRITDLNLTLYPGANTEILFGYAENRRVGTSLFLKDVQHELFRLETPIDRVVRRYSAGIRFKMGPARVLFRQSVRRYDNQFNSFTEQKDSDPAEPGYLDVYSWIQNDDSTADLTDIQMITPIGSRVDLSVTYFGTLFGEETLRDRANVNASGVDFNGVPFTTVDGFNNVELERNTDLVDVDLAVLIANPVTLHLQYRTLDRETRGAGSRDLDNSGTIPVDTQLDQSLDVATALLEYQPHSTLTFRGGFRSIDRDLQRDGFGDPVRDEDFRTEGDRTLVFGFGWRPARWLRLSGDYEDGAVDRSLTEVSLYESKHTRVRSTFEPTEDMQLSLSYNDFENRNDALARSSRSDGSTWAASFSQRVGNRLSYLVAFTRQDIDTQAEIFFDTSAFGCGAPGSCENGDTFYNTDTTSWLGQVNINLTDAWSTFVRYTKAEAEGDNVFFGDTSLVVSDGLIDQDYTDLEAGLTYRLPSGLYVGGSVRSLDYDDVNKLLDYDGLIVTARAGITF